MPDLKQPKKCNNSKRKTRSLRPKMPRAIIVGTIIVQGLAKEVNFDMKLEWMWGKMDVLIDRVQIADCLCPDLNNWVHILGNLPICGLLYVSALRSLLQWSFELVNVITKFLRWYELLVPYYPAVKVCLLWYLLTACVLPSSSTGGSPTIRPPPNRLYIC